MKLRTMLDVGVGNTTAALRRACGTSRTAVIFDAGILRAREAAETVVDGYEIPLDPSGSAIDLDALATRIREVDPASIVAIGGGSTLDAAKLASLAWSDPSLYAYTRHGIDRRSLTLLPRSEGARATFVAVPTTVGTSSEVNAVAIARTELGARLVVGERLRPTHAVLDGESFLSLPEQLLREGCFEALLRVVGGATAGPSAMAPALTLAVALVSAVDRPLAMPRDRLRIAYLGATTQDAALSPAHPFAMKHWYVANETAYELSVRKIPATAAIVPAVWRRIDGGDRRWGEAGGLRSIWRAVATASHLPLSPAEGVIELMRRWGITTSPRPSDEQITRISEASERAWGGGLPALRGLYRDDIADVLCDGAWDSSAPTEPDSVGLLSNGGR